MSTDYTVLVELSPDVQALLYENEFDLVELLQAEGVLVDLGVNRYRDHLPYPLG